MTDYNFRKYPAFDFAPPMQSRQWPDNAIQTAPTWCSVDLRDGNQALIDPMNINQKLRYFDILVDCGFKEIETGFPSASQTEFDFHRQLIEENRIPDDVTIQVLVQAREHLIEKTFESLVGVKRAIVHVYNSTSRVQREKVFQKSTTEIQDIAVAGATLVQQYAKKYPDTEWIFQYSPESFSQTETDYAVSVCEAVCRVWRPETGQAVIINLPATVEASTPNLFADQVEYFCNQFPSREYVSVSLHTHNDRGCAVAAAELGLLAGADRIEGTLFGNGERTGNMDIVTMAMNLYSQGIDPTLDFSNMSEIVQSVTAFTHLPVHPRHPYAGELVFTAFSGSHQDAIKKCLDQRHATHSDSWEIAYLPIDPRDIGRSYQDVVRINSQSGKGGVAYVLQRDYCIELPRWMQIDFSQAVQKMSEDCASELSNTQIWALFEQAYMQQNQPYTLHDFNIKRQSDRGDAIEATIDVNEKRHTIHGEGNGTLTAYVRALEALTDKNIRILNYSEHALSAGTRAEAIAYVQVNIDGNVHAGAAKNHDTVTAMLQATTQAVNAAIRTIS
ncbi:2-isopropylmalate synthase [Ostreibacterium oceani]|uniref:2-isopropylmalate synthase n=1 Tax=Ostreibacterium oceani TaxID=2654998 RepID=A0A6N7EVP7_9GAMM|nr:2-isopropylmalate synthase [Ostreibacterium oceani]MPV85147.1 2-isopropylmalate synthase [Ostreibacterium oceani]